MSAIDVVSDASVALKWFHAEGEEEVDAARALLGAQRDGVLLLYVLDLTRYEVGNALLRGHAHALADQVAIVLEALAEVCPAISPTASDLREAAQLAEAHALTLYDAAYAAVARRRDARLATVDGELLAAGLGRRPSELMLDLAPNG